MAEQHQMLSQKLRGHDGYYGITGNYPMLQDLRAAVAQDWRKWLARRRRAGTLPWNHFICLLKRFPLPAARVVQSVYA